MTAGLLAVLLLAVTVVGASSYIYAQYAVQNLGAQVITEASMGVEQGVFRALEVAETQSLIMENLLDRGLWEPDDHEHTSMQAYEFIKALKDLSYLSLGFESGKYWHVFRDDAGRISVLWLLPQPSGARRLYEFFPTPDGGREVILDNPQATRTPPFERPYYVEAKTAGRAIWTESYVFLGTGEALDIPGVSRSTPIYERQTGYVGGDRGERRLLGVLTADFDLHALSRFLREVRVGQEGFAFIVEERADGSRRVIAHPDAVHPEEAKRVILTEPAPSGEGQITIRAEEIADRRVALLLEQIDARGSGSHTELVRIQAPRGRYMGGYRRLRGEGMPNWTICVLIPREEIVGDVQRMAGSLLLIAAMGVLIVTLAALVTSSRPSPPKQRAWQIFTLSRDHPSNRGFPKSGGWASPSRK